MKKAVEILIALVGAVSLVSGCGTDRNNGELLVTDSSGIPAFTEASAMPSGTAADDTASKDPAESNDEGNSVRAEIGDQEAKVFHDYSILLPTGVTNSDTETLLLDYLPEILRIVPEYFFYGGNYVYLSETSRVILAAGGDLNNDGYADLAIVVEFSAENEDIDGYVESEDAFGLRSIYVLLGSDDGSFMVANKSGTLVRSRSMGGAHFIDPLSGVFIEDGVLSILHRGGSSWRWGYDMQFTYVDDLLALVYMSCTEFHAFSILGEETICDFINHTRERYSWSESDENMHDFLYGGELPDNTILFDTATYEEIESYGEIPFLPNLVGTRNRDIKTDGPFPLEISASEALDLVMDEHYPAFAKVYIPLTQENRDNYSKLLLYEVPDYFYQGEDGVLKYYRLEAHGEGIINKLVHTIIFNSNDESATEFYNISGS